MDFNEAMGSAENFSVRMEGEYNQRNMWDDWQAFVLERYGLADAEPQAKAEGGRKAQQTKDFGLLWKLDEDTGLPLMRTKRYLDEKAGRIQGVSGARAQEWQNMVRQFLNYHHSECCSIGEGGD